MVLKQHCYPLILNVFILLNDGNSSRQSTYKNCYLSDSFQYSTIGKDIDDNKVFSLAGLAGNFLAQKSQHYAECRNYVFS